MKWLAAISVAVMALVTSSADAKAVELTAANFNSELEGKSALVMFKAAWCGHCKAALPAFNEAAALYNGAGSPVVLAIVECPDNQDLCSKYGVSGYPTFKVFDATTGLESGKPYNGGRDLTAFKAYVEENLKPKCSVKDPSGCTDKEKTYMDKMKASSKTELEDQIARLDKMKGSSMAPENKKWLFQRLAILKDLAATA